MSPHCVSARGGRACGAVLGRLHTGRGGAEVVLDSFCAGMPDHFVLGLMRLSWNSCGDGEMGGRSVHLRARDADAIADFDRATDAGLPRLGDVGPSASFLDSKRHQGRRNCRTERYGLGGAAALEERVEGTPDEQEGSH